MIRMMLYRGGYHFLQGGKVPLIQNVERILMVRNRFCMRGVNSSSRVRRREEL